MPGSAGSKGLSADDDDDGDRHENGSNSGSGSDDNEDDDEEREDHVVEGQKWFHGSVPLGLEDDKYWLSELQVYLRAHFAEAFGATEDDIAGKQNLNYLNSIGNRMQSVTGNLIHISDANWTGNFCFISSHAWAE